MRKKEPSASLAFVPEDAALEELVQAARSCHACDLYKRATQTVFGEGPIRAPLMLVGEQPGDQEDKQGHPFVGPAGRVLDVALEAASIPRDQVYVTNVVKHFIDRPETTRLIERLHQSGVRMRELGRARGGRLARKTFVITGTLATLSRDQAKDRILALGGHVASSVSRNTDYLVTGEHPGSKLDTARRLGTRTLDEDAFLALLASA